MAPSGTLGRLFRTVQLSVIAALVAGVLGGCSTPAATFEVSDLEIASSGAEVLPGDDVEVTARVENTGGLAGSYEVALSIDGTITHQQDVTLEPGASRSVTFTVAVDEPGEHAVAIGALAGTLSVTAGPNFAVTTIRLSSTSPEILAGDEVEILADITNSGTMAGGYDAALLLGGVRVSSQEITLSAGEMTQVRFVTTAGDPGSYEVQVGDATTTLDVLAPAELQVTGLTLSPDPVEDDGELVADVAVSNAGGATGSITVKVAIDGKKAGTAEVTVAGGRSATVEVPLAVPKAGKHSVTVGDLEEELVVWDITRPKNGKVLTNKIKGGRGKLTIENGNDTDAVLILAKKSSPKKALLVVYVRAGKDATVKSIKDGTYIVYYGLGERWDAKSKAFTVGGERRRFEDAIKFKTTRTATMITWKDWTLTLNTVLGGNAPTEAVGDGEFPGVP
jgi:hypothetical protein